MNKMNYCTIASLSDYEYFSNHYRLVLIDLSKQIELENLHLIQQINFIDKLQEDNGVAMFLFFIIEKSGKNTSDFSQNSVSIM